MRAYLYSKHVISIRNDVFAMIAMSQTDKRRDSASGRRCPSVSRVPRDIRAPIVVRVSHSAAFYTLLLAPPSVKTTFTAHFLVHPSFLTTPSPTSDTKHSSCNLSIHVLQFLKLFDYLRLSSTRLPSVPFTFSDPSHRCPDATIRRVQTSPNFRYLKATSNLHTLGFAQRIPHVAQLG